MESNPLGLRCVKVIALPVIDAKRAGDFYGNTLGLPPAMEGGEQVGFFLADTILMLKAEGLPPPAAEPNPRVTLEVDDARRTAEALQARGVAISDPVAAYGDYLVGAFLDSEGNKLWFCGKA